MQRREALILAATGAAALGTGALVGVLAIQSASGAGKLLSASFPDLSGRVRRLSEWQGRVTLFNFWATWCAPCLEEMPLLDAFSAKSAVPVVGIGIDSPDKIRDFVAKIGVRYQVLAADAAAIPLMKDLGNYTGGLPFSLVLDRPGRIAARKLGPLAGPDLEGMVTPLLR